MRKVQKIKKRGEKYPRFFSDVILSQTSSLELKWPLPFSRSTSIAFIVRLIESIAVAINGEKQTDAYMKITPKKGIKIKIGKRGYFELAD